ncbi:MULTISPECIES: outer membrane protein assembly factor BamD [Myroides]|uniref:Outer membrane protein assembly factor BamD n=1 Tax=Myroides albus TaxID=2562892 RepID=A0A6I3LJE4_9FLAO|nr:MULTISPECIES: outer membrane protein assembly factor BamD [Myroides]MTG98373.1 outer membrane protein assembly factor BamD [Myroides albus]MVX35724.1 outer membrane protein assembly factor BamD [Myroides sp. LoEW2-1]UVD80366.1 outer membrane protein assembly factor BamD [Myroides albus]
MKRYIGLSFLMLSLVGCSPMQKALKSEDLEYKKEVANQYYEQKKYRRAIRLYEQLETAYRARPDAEEMYYNFAEATFVTKDYELAGSRFRIFAASYPRSEKREEALLKEIKCGVKLSPVYSLDQHITNETIDKLQRFIDQYPTSDFVFEANSIMSEMNKKLERKAFENAKQLNTIGAFTRNYTAAIIALDNFIYDFPGTELKEDALYYKFDSAYKLAMNSVVWKMEERLKNAQLMYDGLIRFNAETKYRSKVDSMITDINKELEKFSK